MIESLKLFLLFGVLILPGGFILFCLWYMLVDWKRWTKLFNSNGLDKKEHE